MTAPTAGYTRHLVSINSLGVLLKAQGKHDEAARLYWIKMH